MTSGNMKCHPLVFILITIILTAGCTVSDEETVTDVKVFFSSTLSPTPPLFGMHNQSPELWFSPYSVDSKGERIVDFIHGDPLYGGQNENIDIKIDYEIWSLNCNICDEKYEENKGTMIYHGTAVLNKLNNSITLDFVDLVPSNEKISSILQAEHKIYAITENQQKYPIIDLMASYALFAKISTREGKVYYTVSEGKPWFFPPIDNFKLAPHFYCKQDSDCKKDWICCYGTCTYTQKCPGAT